MSKLEWLSTPEGAEHWRQQLAEDGARRAELLRCSQQRLATAPHFVYRCFDATGRLLYVGMTSDPERRHDQHRTQAPWFAEMVSYKLFGPIVGADARQRAFRIERAVVAAEMPKYNQRLQVVR